MPPAGSLGPPHLRPAGYRNRLQCPETAPLFPRRLPASRGAPGSRVPATARGSELLRGRDPRSPKAPGPPCASPAPRARLRRAAAPAREMRPLEAPSDGDTGPPWLLAPPAAPSAARGPGDTKRGGLAVCPRSAGAAPKLGLGVNCMRAASLIHVSGVKEPRFPTQPRPGAVAGRTNPTSKEPWLRGCRRA